MRFWIFDVSRDGAVLPFSRETGEGGAKRRMGAHTSASDN